LNGTETALESVEVEIKEVETQYSDSWHFKTARMLGSSKALVILRGQYKSHTPIVRAFFFSDQRENLRFFEFLINPKRKRAARRALCINR